MIPLETKAGDHQLQILANRNVYAHGVSPSCKQKCILSCKGWKLELNKYTLGARYPSVASDSSAACQGKRGVVEFEDSRARLVAFCRTCSSPASGEALLPV